MRLYFVVSGTNLDWRDVLAALEAVPLGRAMKGRTSIEERITLSKIQNDGQRALGGCVIRNPYISAILRDESDRIDARVKQMHLRLQLVLNAVVQPLGATAVVVVWGDEESAIGQIQSWLESEWNYGQ